MTIRPLLPTAPDTERTLLGTILMSNAALASIHQFVNADDFALTSHREIFRAMESMQAQGDPIDIVTLTGELNRRNLLEKVGDRAYISSLIDGVVDRPNPDFYAKTIRDLARARNLYYANSAAMSAILNGQPVDEVIGHLEQSILENVHKGNRGAIRPVKEVARNFAERFQRNCESDRPCIGLSTSIPELDAMTTGLREGDYTIIAGRTGHGKSAFMQQMAMQNARAGHKVYIASVEMTAETFIERGVSMISGIPSCVIRDPRDLSQEQRTRVVESAAILAGYPWVIDDAAGLELHELLARLRAQINRGIEIVFIDYLQMIRCSQFPKTYDRVSAVSAGLRDLAKMTRVPVVAICQLRRPQPGYGNVVPCLYDLKESGSIENDASMVVLIHRPMDPETRRYTGCDELIIAKQRNGRLGSAKVTFVADNTKFEPRDTREAGDLNEF